MLRCISDAWKDHPAENKRLSASKGTQANVHPQQVRVRVNIMSLEGDFLTRLLTRGLNSCGCDNSCAQLCLGYRADVSQRSCRSLPVSQSSLPGLLACGLTQRVEHRKVRKTSARLTDTFARPPRDLRETSARPVRDLCETFAKHQKHARGRSKTLAKLHKFVRWPQSLGGPNPAGASWP